VRRIVRDGLAVMAVAVGSGLFLKLFVLDACRIGSPSMEPTLLPGDYVLVNKLPFAVPLAGSPFLQGMLPVPIVHRGRSVVRRGDILVFRYPGRVQDLPSQSRPLFVKRCIGLPGDTLLIEGGKVSVGSHVFDLPAMRNTGARFGPYVVPARGTVVALNRRSLELYGELFSREGHHIGLDREDSVRLDGVRCPSYTFRQNYVFVVGDNLGDSFDSRSWGPVEERRIEGKAVLLYWSQDPTAPHAGFWHRLLHARWARIGTLVH
jgi:signal peptidase I